MEPSQSAPRRAVERARRSLAKLDAVLTMATEYETIIAQLKTDIETLARLVEEEERESR